MTEIEKLKAVVLLSGGIDSATTLALAKKDNFAVYALSVDYGQRHRVELAAAQKVAEQIGVDEHRVFKLDLRQFGGSALTADIPVPKDRPAAKMNTAIPVTYVPARNTLFLSLALAWAETLNAKAIYVGANAIDYSGYPDCRPEFLHAFDTMANLATKSGVEGRRITLKAPLIDHTKAEIIKLGTELGVDFSLTNSCYDPTPDGSACGHCDSCLIRRKGFREAGLPDPTKYREQAQVKR